MRNVIILLLAALITGCKPTCEQLITAQEVEDKKAYWRMECLKAGFDTNFCEEMVASKEKMMMLDNEEYLEHCKNAK